MRKLLYGAVLAAALLCCSPSVYAAKQWYAVADNNTRIILADIECLLSTDGETEFAILLSNGEKVGGVQILTFEYMDNTDVAPVTTCSDDIVIMHNEIIVSRMAQDAVVKVYGIDGNMIMATESVGKQCNVDISALTPGTYVLNIGSKSTKFMKK